MVNHENKYSDVDFKHRTNKLITSKCLNFNPPTACEEELPY